MMNSLDKAILKRSLIAAAMVCGSIAGGVALADIQLPPQDMMVTTIIDKSVLNGNLAHNADGTLNYDGAGNARFQYTGKMYSIETNPLTGELKEMEKQIGTIEGEAAFPPEFVGLSAAINYMMGLQAQGYQVPMPPMPAIVRWTCNHCRMTVGDSTYVSIVDALDPVNGNPAMIAQFDQMIAGGASQALTDMRMEGRAFTGITPASYDPFAKTMSVRMAGCSAVVAISGSHAGKMGTLCMNSTATFNVGQAIATIDPVSHMPNGYTPDSNISGQGTSNCNMVLHKPLAM